jgi:uncharacterized protein
MARSHEDRRSGVHQANLLSAAIRARRLMLSVIVLGLVGIALVVWLWFARERPPTVLTVGAGPLNSDSYQLIREVAEVVERHSDRIRLKVIATADSSHNIALLNIGGVDLATIRADTPVISNIRLVADLFPDFFQILVAPGSGINRIGDLAGKRVAIPAFGTDEFRSFWVVGDHYDLSLTAFNWQAVPFETAAADLLAGRIDALFTVRSLRDRLLLNLFEDATLKGVGIRFLEIDQAEAIAVKRPFLSPGRVPKGTYVGNQPTPDRDKRTAVVERVLVSRDDVDAASVAELTRVLFENRLDLTIRFALASAIRQPDLSLGLNVPLHDGAAQFYTRDEPNFLQQNAEPLALMVTVFAMLLSGLYAIRTQFINRQKNRMDTYNYELLAIADRARAASADADFSAIRMEMVRLLESVVHELDTDEVTAEGFLAFSRLWESVREIVNECREEAVGNRRGSGEFGKAGGNDN